MIETPESPETTEQHIGPDRVFITGEVVSILALHEMTDFVLREFRRVPILFQGKKYYLYRKGPGPDPYEFRYDLVPWNNLEPDMEAARKIVYDEDYVAERERSRKSDQRQEHWHGALLIAYPLLGLCWSKFKERVLGPMGFAPRGITEASLMMVFGFFLLEGVFVLYFHLGFLGVVLSRASLLPLDWLLFLILPLDCAVRAGHVIRGDVVPCGFLEWVFRRKHADSF